MLGVIIKIFIVLLFAAAVLGGGYYFVDKIYLNPRKLDQVEKEEAAAAAKLPPPPHPSLAVFEELVTLRTSPDLAEARAAFEGFLRDHPDSPKAGEARSILGEINADFLLSTRQDEGKETYTVVRGDSLAAISSKTGVNVELIMRNNNLLSHNLAVGQELLIPKVDITVLVDSVNGVLTLSNHGRFFKEYLLMSCQLPSDAPGMATEVTEKFAMKGNQRVAFGGADYTGAERTIQLGRGLTIRAMPEPAEEGAQVAIPAGMVLARPEMEEIFSLVRRGTPVTIQ